MKKYIIPFLMFFTFISCTQWKVSSLNSTEYLNIKNGEEPGSVKIVSDDYALETLSFSLGIFNSNICIADNILKRVQILEPNGRLKIIIGNLKEIDPKKIRGVNFNFRVIGSFTMDSKDNLYVQNRFPQSDSVKKFTTGTDDQADETDFSPSYILVFNSEGELQYTLGQRGAPDMPFYHIESLDIDAKERLFVITHSFNTWSIHRFDNKKRDFSIDLGKIDFDEKDGNNIFKGKLESVRAYRNGEYLLLSVAYYHDLRLKYRKIFEFSIAKNAINRTVLNIPDPRNVLFNIIQDKLIYFWNMNNKEVRFMISNMEGNVVNNMQLNFSHSKNYYTRLISDNSGTIFSYHATNKGIKVMKWE